MLDFRGCGGATGETPVVPVGVPPAAVVSVSPAAVATGKMPVVPVGVPPAAVASVSPAAVVNGSSRTGTTGVPPVAAGGVPPAAVATGKMPVVPVGMPPAAVASVSPTAVADGSPRTGTTGVPPVAAGGVPPAAVASVTPSAVVDGSSRTGTTGVPPVAAIEGPAKLKRFPPSVAIQPQARFSSTLQAGDYHHRNLPHLTQFERLLFVTFRLADSLPQVKLHELEMDKQEWLAQHPQPWSEEVRLAYARDVGRKIDRWLDAGYGECILAQSSCREIVERALEFFNDDAGVPPAAVASVMPAVVVDVPPRTGTTGVPPVAAGGVPPVVRQYAPRYSLHAYIVMPNHVHVLFEIYPGYDVADIVGAWKSYTAKAINRALGRTGIVWRAEYYDRLVRDEAHYRNVLAYMEKNEAAARAIFKNASRV